jgi:SAM-dependent methyltransferase
MAISFDYLKRMADDGWLKPGIRFLDIGCSNLYNARTDDIIEFMSRFGVSDDKFATDMAASSANKSAFAGELLVKCGVNYDAIDFAPDYKTTKFDLNKDSLSNQFRGAFDLVVNFGTTEHVINQANAFTVIHDAAKPGGVIFNQLPCGGFFHHCYFLYTGRFFFDLAGYNGYEVIKAWIEQEPSSLGDLSAAFRDYESYFPVLKDAPPIPEPFMRDSGFNVAYRKVQNVPFKYPMELSTAYTKPSLAEAVPPAKKPFLKRIFG